MSDKASPPVAARWFATRSADRDANITRIDLGDRRLSVLHLPGHSPGSIGLLDERHGVLFSGDAIYDGTLLDALPGSDVAAYVSTIRTLRELEVVVVHAGHNDSFGPGRLRSLCDAYLARRA